MELELAIILVVLVSDEVLNLSTSKEKDLCRSHHEKFSPLKRITSRVILLSVLSPTAGLAAFSNADLAGTWHCSDFFDHPVFNDPGWVGGTTTINSSGTVTGGSLVTSEGLWGTVTSASLSLISAEHLRSLDRLEFMPAFRARFREGGTTCV